VVGPHTLHLPRGGPPPPRRGGTGQALMLCETGPRTDGLRDDLTVCRVAPRAGVSRIRRAG
jgi:hypothetical protein